jgi:5'-methylthioadenosine/S-adenosylhomocysteine nucleosidase
MYSSSPIIILGALDAEVQAFIQALTDGTTHQYGPFQIHEGTLENQRVVICQSGVGKVAASMTTQFLIDRYQPQAVLFTGVAGALNPSYEVGDIVLATDCVQYDMDARGLGFPVGNIPYTEMRFFKSDSNLLQAAMSSNTGLRIHQGRILTGDRFVTQEALPQLMVLNQELMGDAVEMEGAAVAQVCTIHKMPFLIIRTISDKANADSPIDFPRFLPTVAQNSFAVVKHILNV